MSTYDPYSTHLPFLARAIHRLGGPVLELGAGWYSTPMIRSLCDDVVTLETHEEWISQFDSVCGNNKIIFNPDFYNGVTPYLNKHWSVVFIDCYSAEQRTWVASRLTDVTCIVAHDTENDYWASTIAKFKYVKHWNFQTPQTSYFSNIFDVTSL